MHFDLKTFCYAMLVFFGIYMFFKGNQSADTLGIKLRRVVGWGWLVLIPIRVIFWHIDEFGYSPIRVWGNPWEYISLVFILAFALGPGLALLFVAKQLRQEKPDSSTDSSLDTGFSTDDDTLGLIILRFLGLALMGLGVFITFVINSIFWVKAGPGQGLVWPIFFLLLFLVFALLPGLSVWLLANALRRGLRKKRLESRA